MEKVLQSVKGYLILVVCLVIYMPIQAEGVEKKMETIQLTAVGDIMMHQKQIDGGYDKSTGEYSFDYMFSAIKPYIENADIAVGNLETTLAGKAKKYTGYPQFNAPEQLAWALKNTGFDVLTLANNHSLDRRFYGVQHTIEVLEQAGIQHTGTARTQEEQDKVLMIDVKGIKIAFMAYTYGTNGIPMDKGKNYSVNLLDKNKIARDIEEAKKQGADLLCVSMHFGEEYKQVPNATQKEWVKFLTDRGVDIVLGSHPHVLQPMGFEGDSFVIYSLGNFVSAQTTRPRNSSIILHIMITKDFETGETTIDSVDYIPIWTDLSKVSGKDHCMVLPVEKAISIYEHKIDSYMTSKDYAKLKESLADTTRMYKRPHPENRTYKVLGEDLILQTIKDEGHLLVEVRKLMDRLGKNMRWDEENLQFLLQGEETMRLRVGVKHVVTGEKIVKLAKAPVMIDGKTFVPIRSVVELLGYSITYDPTTEAVGVEQVMPTKKEIIKNQEMYIALEMIK